MSLRRVAYPDKFHVEVKENNFFPYWLIIGRAGQELFEMTFCTKKAYSETCQWLEANVGKGSQRSAGQYLDQAWFLYSWSDRYGELERQAGETYAKRELIEPGGHAICFRKETDLVLFKMFWG